MSVAREYAEAIALFDGTILVIGGRDYPTPHASAEIYDPACNSWRLTGSMNEARFWFARARLQDGRVLVAGGYGDSGRRLVSAEIYDPPSEQWIVVAPMLTARTLPSAVVLRDGRVLIIGGVGENEALSSAEVYDPDSDAWTSAGSMAIRRFQTAAILLPETGDVLVAGSGERDEFGQPVPRRETELYDPASNSWTMASPMNMARWINPVRALLASGRVLIAGGEEFFEGGLTSETYDPRSNTWMRVGDWHDIRIEPGFTLLSDGRILVAGGWWRCYFCEGIHNSAEIFDESTGRWELVSPMAQRRRGAPSLVALPDGEALVAGGSYTTTLANAERFSDSRQ
jgi:N-acetylneuraminic acid mutarotase